MFLEFFLRTETVAAEHFCLPGQTEAGFLVCFGFLRLSQASPFFLQIPVVADLPVGDNLQDHVTSDGLQFFTPYYLSISPARAENFLSSWAYFLWGGGQSHAWRKRKNAAFYPWNCNLLPVVLSLIFVKTRRFVCSV